MTTTKADLCGHCMEPWQQQSYPRRGPREQCGKCGSLRPKPGAAPPEDMGTASTAATMEMYTAGVMTFHMKDSFQEIGLAEPNPRRASRRIEQFARMLRENNPAPRASDGGEWSIVQVYANSYEGGRDLTAVYDTGSQLIIATGVNPVGEMPGSTLRLALARAKAPPSKITTNIVGIRMNQAVEENIHQSHALRRESLDDITRGNRLGEFIQVIEARKKFQGKPSQEFLENFLEILAQDLNYYRAISPEDDTSPAQAAGLMPAYETWDEAAGIIQTKNNNLNNLADYNSSKKNGEKNGEKNGNVLQERVQELAVSAGRTEEQADSSTNGDRREDHGTGPAAGVSRTFLDDLQEFIDRTEKERDELREQLKRLDEDTDSAWKLCASIEDGAMSQNGLYKARGPEKQVPEKQVQEKE